MAKEKKQENPIPEDVQEETEAAPGQETEEAAEAAEPPEAPDAAESKESTVSKLFGKSKKDQGQLLAEAADKYLRLAAEYDNYRKRTAKEKENAWTEAKAQTVAAFLPVYDNLERGIPAGYRQPC